MATKRQNGIIDFITQDVKNESETKELAVLIRCLALTLGIYYCFISVLIACLEFYYLSLILVFSIGMLTGAFIFTYENKTQTALLLLCATFLLSNTFLTTVVGLNQEYHWMICITVPLIFFNLKFSQKFKIRYAVMVTAYVLCITAYAYYHPVLRQVSDSIPIIITIINLFTFCLAVAFVAYFSSQKFTKSEEKIMQYTKKLIDMASLDALTGLYNRRHMNDHLKEMAFNSSKTNKTFCIAIGDVDFFKSINDTYGHDTGDYVLVTISDIFKQFMSDKGTVARWGGEEFLFAFDTEIINLAYTHLEQLRKKINTYNFEFKEYKFNVSMTFGVEEYNENIGVETTITRADSKLYVGKKEGRNRVIR
ncbi:MAG: GGDEF domain-containing protein [Lachnospiraceae bacterium]|nr:GGDEF domain-containing protein [Lachnospiraceae bacterium]MBQ8325489.1 GGDEF domain-containing protein [Lachnospiraceae bacterium]